MTMTSIDSDLITKLESLKEGSEESELLGFYVAMVVIAMAPRLAGSIRLDTREGKTNDACAQVSRQVQEFTKTVGPLLEHASSSSDKSLDKQLVSMAKAAMKVPFEYLSGTGMSPNLSLLMMNWGRTISGAERKESQSQLENALRSAIDSRV